MPGRELGRDKGVERGPSPAGTQPWQNQGSGCQCGTGIPVRSWERKEGPDQVQDSKSTAVFL